MTFVNMLIGCIMKVEVVFFEPAVNAVQHEFVTYRVGMTVADVLTSLGRQAELVGIYGQRVSFDTVLSPDDRIECYEPIRVDPKQVRMKKAGEQRGK